MVGAGVSLVLAILVTVVSSRWILILILILLLMLLDAFNDLAGFADIYIDSDPDVVATEDRLNADADTDADTDTDADADTDTHQGSYGQDSE